MCYGTRRSLAQETLACDLRHSVKPENRNVTMGRDVTVTNLSLSLSLSVLNKYKFSGNLAPVPQVPFFSLNGACFTRGEVTNSSLCRSQVAPGPQFWWMVLKRIKKMFHTV